MSVFQDIYWGYQFSYPDEWIHRNVNQIEAFAANADSFKENEGPQAGCLMVHAEWNGLLKEIKPLWSEHIGKTASLMGARNVAATPWKLGALEGFEAEIVLPKINKTRLWTGILSWGYIVLHFMVEHPKENRGWFEPQATRIITSLGLLRTVPGVVLNELGLPLPPEYQAVAPLSIINDIPDSQNWLAYSGNANMGALQAFFQRETVAVGWEITEMICFPDEQSDLGFARLCLQKDGRSVMLGIIPSGNQPLTAQSPADVVMKINA